MKKIISIILAATMVFMLSACGNSGTSGAQDNTVADASEEVQDNTETGSSEEAETAGQQTAGTGNVLIAYLSFPMAEGVDAVATASRTQYEDGTLGNTNYIAHLIQKETGGDLFAIEMEEGHYPTDDFEAMAEIARDEIGNGDRPAMRTQLENLDDYDVIFVGYPIWWYDMPAVMYTFFDEYDFSGKTIIPFTTHGGSRLSGTPEKIEELEPGATISDNAFTVSRDSVTGAEDDVAEWISSLNLGQ